MPGQVWQQHFIEKPDSNIESIPELLAEWPPLVTADEQTMEHIPSQSIRLIAPLHASCTFLFTFPQYLRELIPSELCCGILHANYFKSLLLHGHM